MKLLLPYLVTKIIIDYLNHYSRILINSVLISNLSLEGVICLRN
jgi:hypothetical protein